MSDPMDYMRFVRGSRQRGVPVTIPAGFIPGTGVRGRNPMNASDPNPRPRAKGAVLNEAGPGRRRDPNVSSGNPRARQRARVGSSGRMSISSSSSSDRAMDVDSDSGTPVPTRRPTPAPVRVGPKPPSVANLQAKSQGNMGTDGDEVPVMPHGKVSKIHPDYFTINLPFVRRFATLNATSFPFTHDDPFCTIRLNSIYDPVKRYRQAVGEGVGNLPDPLALTANTQPQGRDIWSAHFKYYRVLAAQVKVTILSNCPMHATTVDPFLNNFVVGYELTDEDQPVADTTEMFLITKHAKRKILKACPSMTYYTGAANTQRSTAYSTETFTYNYSPNSWDYHVEEKGSEERWTPIGANPSIDHEFHVRVMHLSDTAPDGTISILLSINYLVQFREAVDSFFKTRLTETASYPDAEGEEDD